MESLDPLPFETTREVCGSKSRGSVQILDEDRNYNLYVKRRFEGFFIILLVGSKLKF